MNMHLRRRFQSSLPTVFAAALFAAVHVGTNALSAQCSMPCFQMFDDAVYDDRSSTSGGLILAIQFQVTSTVAAQRLEIWTGESTGNNELSLWSHNATTGTPGSLLSSGTYTQSTTKAWQGANLARATVLMPTQTYWLGVKLERSSQISARQRAANNSGQPYRASRDNGQSWGSEFRQWEWKFRVFCCTKTSPVFATFGNSCGPRGVAPILSGNGLPALGQTYTVDVRSTSVNFPVLLTLGASKTMFGAFNLPLDLTPAGAPGCSLLCSVDASAPGVVGSNSVAQFPVPIPQNNALLGVRFYHQAWLINSVANTLGIAFSNGAEVVIGN